MATTKRAVWLALSLSASIGCNSQTGTMPDPPAPADLSVAAAVDLAMAADLSTASADLAAPSDLAGTRGDRCEIAIPLATDGVVVDGDTSKGFTDDYQFMNTSTLCSRDATSTYRGKDTVYAVKVPAGKTVTVTLTPKFGSGTWYPMLALITDCAMPGPSCVSAQDTVIPNSKDRVTTFNNQGLAERTVYALVDTFDAAGVGQYSIKATLN